ncbi:DUF3043 domain-containing protein [Glutamicibacter protophormiae]|uniref:DUF3043 domain-containing protein n=1 Tax=Kocuria varians TaxID=1272 RepID=A0A7D7L047_KOCVA|nr:MULTISPECIES: DUF3043 domain-containing protein [Kocuria]QMS57113.1 hypothetical protein CIB50_0001838 [Kocuria varians]RUP83483.1 DUF3043 domain-containing protein [Kocuria sp. HSID17590]RUQ11303.1 DUF3043 domain-containing protein [Kocuria sp. HSID17582]WNB89728.1 DUF3043 domain-containing protein [Glutamicibacter protophormiae]
MFGRKKADQSSGSTAVRATAVKDSTDSSDRGAQSAATGGKKGRPTPTRREQEAARRRPLIPEDRKAAKEESKQLERERRAQAQAGMAAGDERYLGPRDAGPQRRFARDWVDSRFNIGEYVLIVLLLIFVVMFLPVQSAALTLIYVVYGYVVLCVLDAVITTTRMHSAMRRKFGTVQRGTRWYAAMRTFTIRRLRLPKPQVRRGERPA